MRDTRTRKRWARSPREEEGPTLECVITVRVFVIILIASWILLGPQVHQCSGCGINYVPTDTPLPPP